MVANCWDARLVRLAGEAIGGCIVEYEIAGQARNDTVILNND
ncbi:MAG: hypothetical protein ACI3ZY_05555 [Parabacteroides sp.]